MITFNSVVAPGANEILATIAGMRNPMNSWDKSDSYAVDGQFVLGNNDADLMGRLASAGETHRKFMRMMTLYVTIEAPLYWWKEFDTYKVGTVANSCSTMHKIMSKEFEVRDFSHEHLTGMAKRSLRDVIEILNYNRNAYINCKDEEKSKEYWWNVIQFLPSSYNQKRTVMLNYEVLAHMYQDRKSHKLDEWREFCKFCESLPMSALITE